MTRLYVYRWLKHWLQRIDPLLGLPAEESVYYYHHWFWGRMKSLWYWANGLARKVKPDKGKILNASSPGSVADEIRGTAFNRLQHYVEGYMATIAHRFLDTDPRPLPPGRKARGKIGLRALKAQAQDFWDRANGMAGRTEQMLKDGKDLEEIGEWQDSCRENANKLEEIARIYRQLTGAQIENPYWDRYKSPDPAAGNYVLEYADDRDVDEEKQREIGRKASAFDTAQRKRREQMLERLLALRHMLTYD